MLNFKKSQPIIKLFFTFTLAGAFLAPLPVFAEDEPDNPTIEEPAGEEKPGGEWSGVIEDQNNDNIKEPSIPNEPSKKQPAETVITEVIVITSPPAQTTTTPAQTKSTENTSSTSTPITPAKENSPKTPEITEETSPVEAKIEELEETYPENTTRQAPIEVPKTSHPDNTRKIRLIAIVSTFLVIFMTIGLASGIQLFKITHTEESRKKRLNQKSAKKLAKKTKKIAKSSAKQLAKDTNPLLLPPSH